MDTQKSICFQNIYNSPQKKLQNKKAATYFGQQKQAWKKKFFPRQYSVFNPKYVTALNLIKAKEKEKRVNSVSTSR